MNKFGIGAAAALALTCAVNAGVVMDFEELAMTGGGFDDHGYVYTAGDWMVSHPDSEPFEFATAHTDNPTFYQGSTMLFNNTVGGVITFARIDGAAFTMESIDLATLFVGGNAGVDFVAELEGGGTVGASYTLLSGDGAENFSFAGLGFDSITSLTWVQDGALGFHQFDNIAAAAPAPGALALLGLAGFAGRRRRNA